MAGYNIRSSMSNAFEYMGYCSQRDTLWDDVTLEEHLLFYAGLQGYRADEIFTVVDQ